MGLAKNKFLLNSYFLSQFNQCPNMWMLYSRSNNDRIKYQHETWFQRIYRNVIRKRCITSCSGDV